ncbi:MAG: cytochrome ubiquinol oxidase subunit I, partial [Acidobacteria bacterium]|nr:cytochrome ubiquinol oxidase subunit I [Acidobacteriota bacterium]
WIFGRGKLSERVHLATIWAVAIGTQISAFFILAASAWMQHPVGYRLNPDSGRAEMTDFFAVISNSTLTGIIGHTVLAAVLTAAMFVLGVSATHLARGRDTAAFGRSARLALVAGFLAVTGVAFVGHSQAQLVARQQPMKMAAAEALYETERGASFSLLTIGNLGGRPVLQIRVPHLLSVLATNSWNGTVQGIDDVQASYERRHGPGSYVPPLWMVYWSFRAMTGAGFLLFALTGAGLVLVRRGRLESSRRFLRIAPWAIGLPVLANLSGWVFTEVGRQPWVVVGLLRTEEGVSPSVGAGQVTATLAGFTVVYGFLAVVGIALMARLARAGTTEAEAAPGIVY